MPRVKNYYKVVHNDHGLFSVSYWNLAAPLIKEYKVGKTTEADFGGLLVFDNIKDARQFIKDEKSGGHLCVSLYKCECSEPVEVRGWSMDNVLVWDYQEKSIFWPKGSCAFRKVKLTKKIK